jgi:hypothetical protein
MGVMQNHLVYRKELADRKIVVVFRPVADPKETYDLAIVEAEDGAVAHEFGIRDPSISMVLFSHSRFFILVSTNGIFCEFLLLLPGSIPLRVSPLKPLTSVRDIILGNRWE